MGIFYTSDDYCVIYRSEYNMSWQSFTFNPVQFAVSRINIQELENVSEVELFSSVEEWSFLAGLDDNDSWEGFDHVFWDQSFVAASDDTEVEFLFESYT